METVSVDAGQLPTEMLHTNLLSPKPRLFTPVDGFDGSARSPEPEILVQIPVPDCGVFPFRFEPEAQRNLLLPASAVVGTGFTTTSTVSELEGQIPFEMVQDNRFNPVDKPETIEVADAVFAKTAVPEISFHSPVPVCGVFPAKVVWLLHRF